MCLFETIIKGTCNDKIEMRKCAPRARTDMPVSRKRRW